MKKLLLPAFTLLFLSASRPAQAEPISIIVNAESKLDAIEEENVIRLYLGRSSNVNGIDIKPIDFKDDVSLAQEFRQRVLKKNPVQYQQYWARLLFTGKGKPPTANIPDPLSMVAAIEKDQNAIGYTDQKKLPEGVKVILVIE